MTGPVSGLPSRQDVENSLSAGNLARALSDSTALLDSDPGNPEFVALHGATLLANGKPQAAVDVLSVAARAADAPYAITSGLAICQVAAGDPASAIESFRRALAQHPQESALRLMYSECLQHQGNRTDAVQQAFRAVHDAQAQGGWLDDASTPPPMRERVKRAMAMIDQGRQSLFEAVLQPHIAAFGATGMQRVAAALGVYLQTHAPVNPDPRQRPSFLWMPALPPTPFYPRERFDWYDALEAATADIRDEFSNVAPLLGSGGDTAGPESDPGAGAGDAYSFHRRGKDFAEHLAACPRTAAALAGVPLRQIANHAPEVMFSVLAPGTHVKPRHGITNTRVVTHLPLIVPQGDCRLVVGGEARAWQEGRCVTFDDTLLHEAWNRSSQQRVVLVVDTWNPDTTEPERIALRDLVEKIGEFNLGAGIS
ncbi:aspartyl/asparaginyl beta-hydroxylase domain-containing protein [Cognatiluteimonas profundi]|uniref:aspartyl/asparaginyl beta-hydroxylase domain-containing protein n=1 Tax=Cognatiluteimonas profundi TaxID=2594501 RepID=UPI00131B1E56|nr:aspartyl/asparaginyl beta-hydroxylase domain-containing protein [Lysobacter profundi]